MYLVVLVACAGLAALALWRGSDYITDARRAAALRSHAPSAPHRFDPAMVADLPEQARRYLCFAIAPGTQLTPVARFKMTGTFRLGPPDAPRALSMTAHQTHAAPAGFLWSMRARGGAMAVSGSDSARWTRFWAMGLIPVARVGDTADHRRSALGRLFMEAAIWTPAATLLTKDARWEAPAPDIARVCFVHDGLTYAIDLTLEPDGRPISGVMQRWSDANPDREHRLQPFGGTLSEFETYDGYTIPTRVSVGHFFGTEAFHPFFDAKLTSARFLIGGD